MDFILNKIKAVAGAVAGFVAIALMVWADKSVSLDEINTLWLALVPILVGFGVYAAPKNKES